MGVSHVSRLAADVEAAFGVYDGSAFLDQRLIEKSMQLKLIDQRLNDQTTLSRLHDINLHVDGSQFGSSVSFNSYLTGLSAALVSGSVYTAPATNLAMLLNACMGGNAGGAGTVIDNTGTTTTTSLVVSSTAGFSKGGAVVVSGQMREIKNISGPIILKHALGATPASGTTVYNCATFYLDEDGFGTDGQTVSLAYQGMGTAGPLGDFWRMLGCAGDFTIGTSIDELVTIAFEMQCAAWSKTSTIALAGASYVDGGPLPAIAGQLQYQVVGTTTLNIMNCDSWAITPGLKMVPERTLEGIQTVRRWRMLRADTKAQYEVNAYGTQSSSGTSAFDGFWTNFDANSRMMTLLQIGNTPRVASVGTGVIGISIPNGIWSAAPERTESGDLVRVKLSFDAAEDDDVTSPTTDIHYSKIRIHLA